MNFLITGGTGFVGTELVEKLLALDHHVYLISRPKTMARAHKKWGEQANCHLLEGDLTQAKVILQKFKDEKELAQILDKIDAVVHLAANYDLAAPYADCFLHNVVATQNILYLASSCKKLSSFHHISTIAISGNYQGNFKEEDLDLGQKFSNHYASTKFDAEVMLRSWKFERAVKVRVYRPGIIVGDSLKGKFKKIDGPYYFLKFLDGLKTKRFLINALKYLPLPIDPKADFPIVPVDWAVQCLTDSLLGDTGEELFKTYHLTLDHSPTVGTFIQDSFDAFGFNVSIVGLPESKINTFIIEKLGLPKELLDYVYNGASFKNINYLEDFPQHKDFNYNMFKQALFAGAQKKLTKMSKKDASKGSKQGVSK